VTTGRIGDERVWLNHWGDVTTGRIGGERVWLNHWGDMTTGRIGDERVWLNHWGDMTTGMIGLFFFLLGDYKACYLNLIHFRLDKSFRNSRREARLREIRAGVIFEKLIKQGSKIYSNCFRKIISLSAKS
jgi:hypothetical protein